ncbi:hypothetical protein BH10PSE18_BH10PSE18_45080 [soil metagenome]
MIAPSGFTNTNTNTQNVGGQPPPPLLPIIPPGSAASAGATGTSLPTDTPIQKLSDLASKFEVDHAGQILPNDNNLALVGQMGELSDDSTFQKTAWQLRQQLQRGDKVLRWESHTRLSKALTESSGGAPAFQSPGTAPAGSGATREKQALDQALSQLTLLADDAHFEHLQASVRDAIPLLPKHFFAQVHEVIHAGGAIAECFLRAVNGGHVFQTKKDFDLEIRTPLFFPSDRSLPCPLNLNLAEKKRLVVLADRMSANLR